jgi:hypothetical protein
MKHRVVAEVELILDEQDQGYAATEAEARLLLVSGVTRVIVQKSQKDFTGPVETNYGVTRVESPVIQVKVEKKKSHDPGVSFTVVGDGKK